jgi:CubicO group peptidase (beta-lactamase class C family)
MRQEPSRRRFLAGVGGVCTGTAAAATAAGRPDDAGGVDAGTATSAAAVTSQDGGLADTVADLVETSLDDHDLAGATVAVVADGAVELAEGFGLADREDGREATAGTPFRIGSVSKAVTWTALMRRIRRGALEPDTDVSTVVDVPVPDSKGPVTPADLATHRAGLEDGNSQLWIQDADDLRSLPAHLRRATISQVREPGEAGSYSNYGAALAGQALAAARDDLFETAIEDELLAPAGMESSTFRQPLPDSLAADHATGYAPGSAYRSGEFPFVGLRPAGAMSTTAADMARFLQLHVTDGVVDGKRVLAPETVDALHRQWATHHEELTGMAFGLVEEYRGDVRLLRHNGATLSFTSDMVLVPERGLGLFVSYNGSGAGGALSDVVEGFLDASLGEAATGGGDVTGDPGNATGSGGGSGAGDGSDESVQTPTGDPVRADALAGTYRSVRRSETGHDRVTTTLQAPTVEVGVSEDGALTTSRGSVVHRWVEVEPLVFEHVDEDRRLAFLTAGEGIEGSVEYLCFDGSVSAFAPVEGFDRLSLHALLVGVTMLAMASAVAGWPAAAAVRWYRRDDASLLPSRARLRSDPSAQARWAAGGAIAAFTAFLALVVGHFVVTPLAVLSAPPLTFKALFALSVPGGLGALASVGYAGHALLRGSWSLVGRAHYAVVAASLVGFTWLLAYWNLLLPP